MPPAGNIIRVKKEAQPLMRSMRTLVLAKQGAPFLLI